MSDAASGPLRAQFEAILAERKTSGNLAEALADRAFDLFEANIGAQTTQLPPLACAKGCPACCALRVTATAPEIFLLARYVRKIEDGPAGSTLGLARRIAHAHRATRGLSERERMIRREPCPLIIRGVCIIHPVRPLACRGHASFDRRACAQAMAGRDVEVPVSAPHNALRGLIQDALRSAVNSAGLPADLYELNHGLVTALDDASCERAWMRGVDSLAAAGISAQSPQ